MKSIAAVNTQIPTVDNCFRYFSGESLRDYDIAIFDPKFPDAQRIEFTGGGSCLAVESTASIIKAMAHWSGEIGSALSAGKTIFLILNTLEEDQGATGSSTNKNQRTYNTTPLNNYQAVPAALKPQNSRGRKIVVADGAYRGLVEALGDIAHYRVVVSNDAIKKIYAAGDGAMIGGVVRFKDWPGSMVLLPYFDFNGASLGKMSVVGKIVWNEEALKKSRALVGQLVAIDRMLRSAGQSTPPPDWLSSFPLRT